MPTDWREPEWHCHCAEFADAKAGTGLGETLGGWPRSPREAADLFRRFGVRTMADLVSCLLEEIPPLQAMRGDVVMVDGALGVCRGEWAEFMDRMQPMRKAQRAWSANAVRDPADKHAASSPVHRVDGHPAPIA